MHSNMIASFLCKNKGETVLLLKKLFLFISESVKKKCERSICDYVAGLIFEKIFYLIQSKSHHPASSLFGGTSMACATSLITENISQV